LEQCFFCFVKASGLPRRLSQKRSILRHFSALPNPCNFPQYSVELAKFSKTHLEIKFYPEPCADEIVKSRSKPVLDHMAGLSQQPCAGSAAGTGTQYSLDQELLQIPSAIKNAKQLNAFADNSEKYAVGVLDQFPVFGNPNKP
jgi:hypothetical protein